MSTIRQIRHTRQNRSFVETPLAAVCLSAFALSAACTADTQRDSVYVMTNSADTGGGNQIVRFAILPDRTIAQRESIATGGRGAGPAPAPGGPADPLGSQGSMVVDKARRLLFVVNAGSDTFTVFAIEDDGGLRRLQVIPSGGSFPVSITVRDDLVYVLNAGGDGQITGFRIDGNRALSPIAQSTRSLLVSQRLASAPAAPVISQSPNEISFSPSGGFLVVSVKEIRGLGPITATDGFHDGRILVFPMNQTGVPAPDPTTTLMEGVAPYGFDFDRNGRLIVSEFEGNDDAVARGDLLGASAASSYDISPNGALIQISNSVPDFQGGSCWINVSGRFAFIADTDTNAWTTYLIGTDGALSLTKPNGLTASAPVDTTGRPADPIDFRITGDGLYLYSLQPGLGTVATWRIDSNTGDLTYVSDVRAFDPVLRTNDPTDYTPRPTVPFQVIPGHGSPVGLALYED